MSPQYDIILTFLFARIHNYFPAVIHALRNAHRLGVYVLPVEKAGRTPESNETMLRYCRELGADIVPDSSLPVATKVLLVPQHRLNEGALRDLIRATNPERVYSVQSFGLGATHLEPYVANGLKEHIVFDKKIYLNKVDMEPSSRKTAAEITVHEMGDVYHRYPLDETIECDYMVAFPTNLSFETKKAKRTFMMNVLRFLRSAKGKNIVFKIHNVRDKGNRIEGGKYFKMMVDRWSFPVPVLRCITWLSGLLLDWLDPMEDTTLGNKLYGIHLGAQYAWILSQTTPLSNLTSRANLGIEIFLPGVKKGLVTGRTSCVWHALAQKKAVYNCDDVTTSSNVNVQASYEMFGVPPCHGRLVFDDRNFDKVSKSAQDSDLIAFLRNAMAKS